jgi:hypothetical protein
VNLAARWYWFSTQGRQKVHSNVQIIASVESGGNAALHFSHVGLISSMAGFYFACGAVLQPLPKQQQWASIRAN